MANTPLIICGWESGNPVENSSNTTPTTGVTCDSGTKRTGGYSLKCAKSGTTAVSSPIVAYATATGSPAAYSAAEIWAQVCLYKTANPSANCVCARFETSASGLKADLLMLTDGTLRLRDSAGTTLATSAALSNSAWHVVQVRLGTSATVAAWKFIVDNSEVGSGSAANTTATNHGILRLGQPGSEAVTWNCWYDDVIVDTAGEIPYGTTGIKVGKLSPDGNSATNTGFTASSGNKWECIDELPMTGTGDSVTSAVANDVYTATMQACTSSGWASGDTIYGVNAVWAAMRGAASATIKWTIRSGSSPANTVKATAVTEQTSLRVYGSVYALEPVGSTAWTETLVNGLEVGGTRTATTARIDSAIACVAYYTPAASSAGAGPLTGGIPLKSKLMGLVN